MKRVWVFIDGSYFYKGTKSILKSAKVDFHKFSQKLVGSDREYIRTYYYMAIVNQEYSKGEYQKQQRFLAALRHIPYFDVKPGRLLQLGDRCVEKGVDVFLATDVVSLGYDNRYDTCIIVSGDGDFVPAVEAVQRCGKHVENAHFHNVRSYHLIQKCDKEILLDPKFFKDLLMS